MYCDVCPSVRPSDMWKIVIGRGGGVLFSLTDGTEDDVINILWHYEQLSRA
jgi:hypothetical protein